TRLCVCYFCVCRATAPTGVSALPYTTLFRSTTLFAALNVLEGRVIETCQPRHTHAEFLAFLDKIDRQTARRRDIHLILDNYSTPKHPTVKAWMVEHPRFHFHFTPTGASSLKLV